MVLGSGVIKSAMSQRGFKHRRTEDQFTVNGTYARHLQFVYSKSVGIAEGEVVDLVYFSVDIVAEKLVMGLYRENPKVENGVYINTTRSLGLKNFDKESVERELDRLIPPVHGAF